MKQDANALLNQGDAVCHVNVISLYLLALVKARVLLLNLDETRKI